MTEFVTLDGVMQAPEQWVFAFHDEHSGRFKLDEMKQADALLLGRTTYTTFAASWPAMTGELADQMNGIRKYVVSGTPGELDWHNSQAIAGDVVEAVVRLKKQPGRDILVAGSGTLVATLMGDQLVDEVRLFVCPMVLGSGRRLFSYANGAHRLALAEARTFGTGALLLRYTTAAHTGGSSATS